MSVVLSTGKSLTDYWLEEGTQNWRLKILKNFDRISLSFLFSFVLLIETVHRSLRYLNCAVDLSFGHIALHVLVTICMTIFRKNSCFFDILIQIELFCVMTMFDFPSFFSIDNKWVQSHILLHKFNRIHVRKKASDSFHWTYSNFLCVLNDIDDGNGKKRKKTHTHL